MHMHTHTHMHAHTLTHTQKQQQQQQQQQQKEEEEKRMPSVLEIFGITRLYATMLCVALAIFLFSNNLSRTSLIWKWNQLKWNSSDLDNWCFPEK